MKYWSRDDTKAWVNRLETRIKDIEHYIEKTINWLEDNQIYDDRKALVCCFLTCIWVAHMRSEQITYKELLEILGLEIPDDIEDKVYDIGPMLKNIDHLELLQMVAGDPDKFF